MILLANGAPILVGNVFKGCWAAPVDGGLVLSDGRPLFGRSKTWRGLISALLFTPFGSLLLGYTFLLGFWVAVFSMLGDLSSSFIKRRLGMAASSHAPGLDIIFESLFPLIFLKTQLIPGWQDVLVCVVLFFLLEELFSPLLYKIHLRKRPY